MLNNSLLVKEFSYEDDKSVDFSVDPLMYEKLNIKKAKKGEENDFDLDKLYFFQLEKDITKIRAMKGSYQTRNKMYIGIRESDPYYRAVASTPQLASNANFKDLLAHTTETSWRTTSQPYGIIAHKRYLEYLQNLPKGPSEDEIRDKLQRKTDNELWDNIQNGKLDPTRKELRLKERLRAEKKLQALVAENIIDLHKEEREKVAMYKAEDFQGLRRLPTLRQHNHSMRDWHKGVHYPFDMNKGFPILCHDMSGVAAGSLVMIDKHTFESFTPQQTYSSDNFTKKEKRADKNYVSYMSEVSYAKAERYLRDNQLQMEAEVKRAAKAKAMAEKLRRRVGHVTANIADTLTAVKVETFKKDHAFTAVLGGPVSRINGKDDGADEDEDDEDDDSTSLAGSGSVREAAENGKHTSGNTGVLNAQMADADDIKTSNGFLETLSNNVKRRVEVLCGLRSNRYSATVVPFSNDDREQHHKPKARSFLRRVIDATKHTGSRCRSCYLSMCEHMESWTSSIAEYKSKRKSEAKKRRKEEESYVRLRINKLEEQLHASSYPLPQSASTALIPKEEFLTETAAKKKRLRKDMKLLRKKNKVMTADDARKFASLKLRYNALAVTVAEREALDLIDTNKAQHIREYVDLCRQQLESEEVRRQNTTSYKMWHFYSMLLDNRRQAKKFAEEQRRARQKERCVLKPYNADENRRVMDALVELRTKEKEAQHHFALMLEKYLGIERREKVVKYTVDDLILAAQSGRYKDVLDIVLDPLNGVGPNQVSTDGVTATYETLLMIMRNEVLQDDKNLDALLLSPWQRFKKKHFVFGRSSGGAVAAKLEFVLQILLNQGGDVLFATKENGRDGMTIMHCAAETGGIDMLNWLLAKGVDPNLRTTKFLKTPLMVAAECDKLDVVMLLLKSGAIASINYVDKFGWTALHHATVMARPELARVLMICGGKSTIRNAQGRLPQEEATQRGRADMALSIMSFKTDVVDHLSRLTFLSESDSHDRQYSNNSKNIYDDDRSTKHEEEEAKEVDDENLGVVADEGDIIGDE